MYRASPTFASRCSPPQRKIHTVALRQFVFLLFSMWASQRYFQSPSLITILFPANGIPKTWKTVLSAFEKREFSLHGTQFPRLLSFHAPATKDGKKNISYNRQYLHEKGSPAFQQPIHFFHTQYGFRTTHCFLRPPFRHGSKARPHNRGDAFQEKALCRQSLLFYRKKGSKASSIGSCPRRCHHPP